jgi:hypothetical protein
MDPLLPFVLSTRRRDMRVFLAVSLFLSAAAFGQNTCAYQFNLKNNFSFCLTTSGTLASLPGILDPSNPVEGWGYQYVDETGGGGFVFAFPGEGLSYPAGSITQPKGPGTLPIIFDWGVGDIKQTVTANPNARTITFAMKLRSCKENCGWFGQIWRAANVRANGNSQNYLGSSSFAAMGYDKNGVLLTGACPGVASDVSTVDDSGESCGVLLPATLQQGAIYSIGGFASINGKPDGPTITYHLF